MGPDTRIGKLMVSMSNFTEKVAGTFPKEPTQKFGGDDVYAASFKRKLAMREHVTEADTTDPVKVDGWLQWAPSLVRRGSASLGSEYSSACHGLLNTASTLSTDNVIVKTLEHAVEVENCDSYVWTDTCRKILTASVPNAVSQAETAISCTAPRGADLMSPSKATLHARSASPSPP